MVFRHPAYNAGMLSAWHIKQLVVPICIGISKRNYHLSSRKQQANNYQQLTALFDAASKLQRHNEKLFRIID